MKLTKSILAGVLSLSLSLAVPALANTKPATQQPEIPEAAQALLFVNNVCQIASGGAMFAADMRQQNKDKATTKAELDKHAAELKKQFGDDEVTGFITSFWTAAFEDVYQPSVKVLPKAEKEAFIRSTGYEVYYFCVQSSLPTEK